MAPSLSLLFAACVIDTGVSSKDHEPPAYDSGTTPDETDTDIDTADSGPPPDDTAPVACPEREARPAESVPIVEACEGEDAWPDPWNIVVEWQYGSGVGLGASNVTATGHLTDDDGDGVLGSAGDRPEVVYSDWMNHPATESVRVLAGDGSGLLWAQSGFADYRAVAIADVTGDGWTEVLAFAADDTVVALDATGAVVWRSDTFDFLWGEQLAVADLDGDGLPEVIADEAVLNGEDGTTVATLSTTQLYRSPTPGDLDRDGLQEIVLGPDVYDATGTLLWSATVAPSSDVFAALVQADLDPEGEVAFVDDDGYHLYDTDGTWLVSAALPTGSFEVFPGPPCVADFDGDGASELAVATYDNLSVLELDGTLLWSAPTRDWGPTGCSGFDFDADGASEVLTHDIYAIYLLDGRTGAERWSWRPGYQVTNGQGSEYAYVADVDADGAAEIVASTNNDPTLGVIVFGQADGAWPPAGPTWGVQDYSESNLEDDGGVPTAPTPPWESGVFRSRPTRAGGAPDLLVAIEDVCVADCERGAVELVLSVTNQGAAAVAAGAVVELYAVEETSERLVSTVVLPALPAGTRGESTVVSLSVADLGARGFAAVVVPTGAVRECDETNNRDEWLDVFCP